MADLQQTPLSEMSKPYFVNKVFLEHSHTHSLTTVYGSFHATPEIK